MPVQTLLMTTLAVVVGSSVASAQVLNGLGNCVSPAQTSSVQATASNSDFVTLQSQVVTTRTIPVAARLLSSRVVATGWAPATSANSLSTFGTTTAPLSTSFVNNAASTVQPLTTFGVQSTFGMPATFAAPTFSSPTAFTLAPQTVTNSLPVVVPPSAVNVLATRIANDNLRSSAINAQTSSRSCCSAKSLESLSKRLEALDLNLARLEKSLGNSDGSGGASNDDIGELLGGGEKPEEREPTPSDDSIDDLLNGAVD